jgi:hypothetical protein
MLGLVAVALAIGLQIWKTSQRVFADPRLALLNARAEFGVGGVPQIRAQWKNFGTGPAKVITMWMVVTDRSMSNTFVCFGDSAGSIPPGDTGDFWVEFNPTNGIPPWPELAIVTEAQYEIGSSSITETQRWVGILGTEPASRTNKTVSFEPVADIERTGFLSNSARLIQAELAKLN